MSLADLRREYSIGGLHRRDLNSDPMEQFKQWFSKATGERSAGRCRKIGIALYKLWHAILGNPPADVNAMTLATVGPDGVPSSRTVLLKGADTRGFIFYTNYESRKGHELAGNPNAALTFFWADDERQVCVIGTVSKLSREESEAYFKSRPRGSRLGAWASAQSTVVENREVLEKDWQAVAAKYPEEVPIPPHWGGFVLNPRRVEFWQGRPSRLHDRFCYTRQADGSWKIERLSP
ncbi:MAG TPA: pyridoxamine 5'-phosphate oxidase [Verrucomicrobiota bacterium]|nr:pyridoxamine 5'-phosphate oxidase [Verrucomicrobiota bacterium]